MTHTSLQELLARFPALQVLVLGDFFLDRYLDIDPALAEISIETGLEARQVTGIRNGPGAAGTITNNLAALGVGRIRALGYVGEDGQGFDLLQGLARTGVVVDDMLRVPDRFTPTYTKPVDLSTGEEMNRIDIKNRTPTPESVEHQLIGKLRDLLPEVDAVIVMDQVQEPECGVVTSHVREAVEAAALANPDTIFLADSRTRIDAFRHVIIKPNDQEALDAAGSNTSASADPVVLESAASSLASRSGRPIYITRGPDGILAADGANTWRIPGIRVPDPIDIVGAGDSVSASIASALAAGATVPEAALLGVLVSSITIQQLGTTGVATPAQVLARFAETCPDGCNL